VIEWRYISISIDLHDVRQLPGLVEECLRWEKARYQRKKPLDGRVSTVIEGELIDPSVFRFLRQGGGGKQDECHERNMLEFMLVAPSD
jgi:hypothetical protein